MPATEQTWRNSKLLHGIFGLTSLAMLVTTLWMLAADHLREWKDVQRTFQRAETWTAQARIDEQTTDTFEAQRKELEDRLLAAQAKVPPREQLDRFLKVAEAPLEQSSGQSSTRAKQNGYSIKAVLAAYEDLEDARERKQPTAKIADRHREFVASLQEVKKLAKFDEDNRGSSLKFARADLDVERSKYSLGVDEGMGETELAMLQEGIDKGEDKVGKLTLGYQAAKTHRLALDEAIAAITAEETVAQKALDDHNGSLNRLVKAKDEREPSWQKGILEYPIIDAFGRPLKVNQIWLPQLTLNNNFRDVARFDRCTTCHLGIDKTAAGSPGAPGYPARKPVELKLATPGKAPEVETSDDERERSAALAGALVKAYGLKLTPTGPLGLSEVTVDVVWPRTLAAQAGLQAGDVIRTIGDARITSVKMAQAYLLTTPKWGQPLAIDVLRGLPQPFSSHPRLDLFVGSLSPHKAGDFGCTICHEGQGSATAFKWASHTPNDPTEAGRWKRDHGWFNNHHWIYPMNPDRFVESGCLKCHHEVTELSASERFPEAPAPKVLAGYDTIRQYGCFGCHEINGWDGPSKRRGPDMRAEPVYFSAASQVLVDPSVTPEQRRLAREVVDHPENTASRKRLAELILATPAEGKAPSAESRKMAGILGADDATPGQLRKVGPSLRHVASKVDRQFLYSWIRLPKDFRPSTKMPQFFGLDSHLFPDQKIDMSTGQPVFADSKPVMVESPGLSDSKRFEPIEIRGITEYLLSASQKFDYAEPPKAVTEKASAERGKHLFETRGCLACHRHPDFPEAKNTQGPDLAKLGSKLSGERGSQWLYSWILAPNRYHARTVMPNLFLEPIKEKDKEGKETGKATDPAADIVAYLLGNKGWQPQTVPSVDMAALNDLVKLFLGGSFTQAQAQQFVESGIPASMATQVKGDDAYLVADKPQMAADELLRKKLLYVGRRSITRLGCSGCHDIPGFEDAKPIGTGLADWGRKETSKLAFEQIVPYLARSLSHGHGEEGHGLSTRDMPSDQGYYVDALLSHQREGFIWQKLREPRSYDYKKTETKEYTDRLRMPQFNFTDEQREQVITFVLGLVAEPPAAKYIYKADPRRGAIQRGERLLAKFNCTGCHAVQMDRWDFDYKPNDENDDKSFQPPPAVVDYPFALPHFTPEQLAASKKVDRRGLGHAEVTGMPNPELGEDDDGNPLYFFGLWKSAAIDGHAWAAGGQEVPIPQAAIMAKHAQVGGALARLLQPIALADEKKSNPNAKASDAWGWVPPPLVGEGLKVQSQWLHDFLLDPFPIRPAVILRMPRFNMSSDEASQIADYFAAIDGAVYPYEFDPRTRSDYLASEEAAHKDRLGDALKLVTDNNYCVKCHLIGDFAPAGAVSAMAPRLDRVSTRLRPEYVERWVANPKRLLPYTGMPVNFPIDKPADQKLYKGSSPEQLEAVVDLLLNWPSFMKDKTSIKPMVKPAAPAAADKRPVGAPVAAAGQVGADRGNTDGSQ